MRLKTFEWHRHFFFLCIDGILINWLVIGDDRVLWLFVPIVVWYVYLMYCSENLW